jgi:hypothetical protein
MFHGEEFSINLQVRVRRVNITKVSSGWQKKQKGYGPFLIRKTIQVGGLKIIF